VAKSKSSKKKQQAQHRQQHNTQKSRERDAGRQHLPKTGTKADDEYLLRRSREDVTDFGLTRVKRGWVTIAIAIVVVLALLGLMALLITSS
jgi:hypothetical protein